MIVQEVNESLFENTVDFSITSSFFLPQSVIHSLYIQFDKTKFQLNSIDRKIVQYF